MGDGIAEGLQLAVGGLELGGALGHPVLQLRGAGPQGGFRRGQALELLLLGQVGDHHAEIAALGRIRGAGGDEGREGGAIPMLEFQLRGGPAGAQLVQELLPGAQAGGGQMVGEAAAGDLPGLAPEHLRELPVAVDDDLAVAQDHGALAHLLHELPVGPLGPFQGEDVIAVALVHDHGVHLAAADGLERFLGLPQLPAELLELASPALQVWGRLRHRTSQGRSRRSRPSRTRSVWERSPTIRRRGSGRYLMRVGAAMICSPSARLGCW